MAAQFNIQPATQCSAYRPVYFAFQGNTTSELWERALVVVKREGGAELARFTKDFLQRTGSDPYTHFFEVDVQAVAQALTDPMPSSVSGALIGFDALNSAGAETAIRLYIEATFYRRVGVTMESTGTTITSDTVTVFPIVRQHTEDQAFATTLLASPRPLLNFAPDNIRIRENELFTLACIQPTSAARIYVTERKKSGTVSTGHYSLSVSAGNADKRILAAGVGPHTIAAVGSPVTIDENTDTYTVAFADSSNNLLSDTLTFKVEKPFPGKMLRLAWLNSRGAFDHYTFDAIKKTGARVRANEAQRPLTFTTAVGWDKQQRGAYRTDINRTDYWEVETEYLDLEHTVMLAELFASPEVYVEDADLQVMIPAMIEDSDSELDLSGEVGSIVKARVYLANPHYQPRN